ncbi:MAG: tRNA (adenosine(37)-N6)-threonylcarbamoyltransferase complex dimerization subunit type 1 TsaB [Bacteroidetes bacterium]|nr:tRNA (adenosine(37)-N6)-threonylcarbamoyltransferase complex dimerization subunit type 1 TsaB [Bacteroidota bacterium]
MINIIPLLAIETSEEICSAAIYFSDEKFYTSSINLKHSHSEKLFEIIEVLFNLAGINRNEISAIAVSGGPGSFTGLRIGMAAAKGIATGTGVPLLVVPTFEALAFQLSFQMAEGSEFIIANKVNRSEVYYARFQIKSNSFIFADDLKILTNEDFIKKINGIKTFGNAYKYIVNNENNITANSPTAEYIARWAVKFGGNKFSYDYDYFEPVYIKNFVVKKRSKK